MHYLLTQVGFVLLWEVQVTTEYFFLHIYALPLPFLPVYFCSSVFLLGKRGAYKCNNKRKYPPNGLAYSSLFPQFT